MYSFLYFLVLVLFYMKIAIVKCIQRTVVGVQRII